MKTCEDMIKEFEERQGEMTLTQKYHFRAGYGSRLIASENAVADVPCNDGLSCTVSDDCQLYKWALRDKQILTTALREIYNIRGEDRAISVIIDSALNKGCAT